jgi:hypothetical protein
MAKTIRYLSVAGLVFSLLPGCATVNKLVGPDASSASMTNPVAQQAQAMPVAAKRRPKLYKVIKRQAVGFGSESGFKGYTKGQRRLLAMRASKLDGYRSLAEQIYGIRINGNTSVSGMMARNDHFRAYVDAYLRGAKVVSITPMADGNYETLIEIELDQRFFDYNFGMGNQVAHAAPIGAVGTGEQYQASFYYGE